MLHFYWFGHVKKVMYYPKFFNYLPIEEVKLLLNYNSNIFFHTFQQILQLLLKLQVHGLEGNNVLFIYNNTNITKVEKAKKG